MNWSKIFKSKFFLLILFLSVGTMGYFLTRELQQRYKIESEIRVLQDQIIDLEKNNRQLTDLTEYFKTQEYKEKQIREKLNLQKSGEHGVVIQNDPELENTQESSKQVLENKPQYWKMWWDYFFGI